MNLTKDQPTPRRTARQQMSRGASQSSTGRGRAPRPEFLLLFLCLALCGCERPYVEPTNAKGVELPPVAGVEGPRFQVETQGKFWAGYDNNVREILIITDTKTGEQYLGITGVGISDLRKEKVGKNTFTKER